MTSRKLGTQYEKVQEPGDKQEQREYIRKPRERKLDLREREYAEVGQIIQKVNTVTRRNIS